MEEKENKELVSHKIPYQPQDVPEDFEGDYEKYFEGLIRDIASDKNPTDSDAVGQLTDLVDESSAQTYREWEKYYKRNYLEENPDAINNAVDEIIEYLGGTINERLYNIDKQLVKKWVEQLVYQRTPSGLFYEIGILQYISEEHDLEYENSNSQDETEGIDGFLDGNEVQVKPDSYEHGGTERQMPSVATIVYEIQDDNILVDSQQLKIIDEDEIVVDTDKIDGEKSEGRWSLDLKQGHENIINTACCGEVNANQSYTLGKVTELEKMCPYNTVEGWAHWYQNVATEIEDDKVDFRVPKDNPVELATNKTWRVIEAWRDMTDNIENYRDEIDNIVRKLIFFETIEGLSAENQVFEFLSEKYDLDHRDSTAKEESKNIDGYLDGVPIQVKPESYNRADQGVEIDPAIVEYDVKSKYTHVKFYKEELPIDE